MDESTDPAVIGLLALAYREVRDETYFESEEAKQAVRVLSEEFRKVELNVSGEIDPQSPEDINHLVQSAVQQGVQQVGGKMLDLIMSLLFAFGGFCVALEKDGAQMKVEEVLRVMALNAASKEVGE